MLCEGNFQWGNADFDVYLPDSQISYSGMFKKQNSGPLGDVLQSGIEHDNMLWLVLNNSGKIVAVDKNTYKITKEIKGLTSPRYIKHIQGDIGWATDLWGNAIAQFNLKTGLVTGSCKLQGWCEEFVETGNEMAVTNQRGYLFFLDKTCVIKDSIKLAKGVASLVKDHIGKLWVIATDSGKSRIYRIRPENREIELTLEIGASKGNTKLGTSKNRDTIYYLNNGVYAMSASNPAIPKSPIFYESNANYYGFGVDYRSGDLYVSDAKDYVSKGEVVVLKPNGTVKHRFQCGINPGNFIFF